MSAVSAQPLEPVSLASGSALSDIENAVVLPEEGDPDAPREYVDDDVVLHEAPSPVKPAAAATTATQARRTLGTIDY